MSLHRYFPPPPLALAIYPAPVPKPRTSDKDKDKKAEAEAEVKPKAEVKAETKEGRKGKEDGNKDGKEEKEDGGKGDKAEAEVKDATSGKVGDAPPSPNTPASMIPEPPTPAPDGEPKESNINEGPVGDDGEKEKGKDEVGKVDVEKAEEDIKKVPLSLDDALDDAKDSPGKNSKETSEEKKEGDKTEPTAESQSEPELEPLILLPPAPPRVMHARIDLPPQTVYPPVNTDPRGAYHKYAKAVGAQVIYVDVTKDGWLTEQWKERTEREALKRLTGEWERELEREIEKEKKKMIKRKVPKTSEEILLDLWNDLVEANSHEISVDEFWNRYDWTDAEARKHLLPDLKRPEPLAEEKKDESADADKTSEQVKKPAQTTAKPEIEWTRQGVEEILSTVGLQCTYNTEKPSSRVWSEPDAAYLLLAHNHFLLRLQIALTWKPKEEIDKGFEVLVTSANDRVFGEMVKAQQAEERKRLEKEYKMRKKEKEKRERKAKEALEEKKKGEGDAGGAAVKGKDTPDINSSPAKKAKAHNGEAVAPSIPALPNGTNPDPKSGDNVVLAVPITASPATGTDQPPAEAKAKAHERDAKHEDDAKHVPGPKPAGECEDGKAPADGKVGKAQPDAKKLAKAINPGVPEGVEEVEDPAMVLKVLDLAINQRAGSPGAEKTLALALEASKQVKKDMATAASKKDVGPLFWTWEQRCEKWRWRNFEAGCHIVGPGGWEERDWEVFADGREAWDWDADQEEIEKVEVDVHDWSL